MIEDHFPPWRRRSRRSKVLHPNRPPSNRAKAGLAHCRRGTVAIEFVVASIPLMLLMFGFIATSAIFNTWSNMQSNAQYAARLMSTGQISKNVNGAFSTSNTSSSTTCGATMNNTQVEYYACSGLPSWASFTVTTSENCAIPSVTVSLSASAASAAIADIENFYAGKTIVSQAVYMKEGSCP